MGGVDVYDEAHRTVDGPVRGIVVKRYAALDDPAHPRAAIFEGNNMTNEILE